MPWNAAATTKCGLCLIRTWAAREYSSERAEIWDLNRKSFKRQSVTIKNDGGDDRKDRVGNGKVVLTRFTLQVLKESVKDDPSHQCGRQIYLYID